MKAFVGSLVILRDCGQILISVFSEPAKIVSSGDKIIINTDREDTGLSSSRGMLDAFFSTR